MSNNVGCVAVIIAAVVGVFLIWGTGNILLGVIAFIVGIGYFAMQLQEGLSKGSGYRQEKQNQQIIDELKKQNEELKKQNQNR